MNVNLIKTEQEYLSALEKIKRLHGAESNTPEGDRLEILSALVESYEKKNPPREETDPIDCILHRMESMALTRKDLEPILGTRARVSEILTRKRPLTLSMIRQIHAFMGISADVLIKTYKLRKKRG